MVALNEYFFPNVLVSSKVISEILFAWVGGRGIYFYCKSMPAKLSNQTLYFIGFCQPSNVFYCAN